MGKRNQSPTLYAKEQPEERGYNGEDRISELPDEILVNILSLLTMDEATRTSVISNRWKKLWANLPNLHFDASKLFSEIVVGNKSIETERSKFRRWVNQVVKSYQGPTVEEFRVRFDLNRSHKFDIDAWVHFAIRKKVKMLELDLDDYRERAWMSKARYTFPCMPTNVKCLRSRPLSFSGCNSLTFLRLNYVNVTGESIEYLLSNCLLLEKLFVEWSNSLVDLKVDGPSLKLKILKICHCDTVKNIEISAKDLMSLTYIGSKINLSLKNVPQLVELYFGGCYCTSLSCVLCQPSSYIFQLESLTLGNIYFKESAGAFQIPMLYNLKHLKLMVWAKHDKSLLGFISLLEACPFLCKFSLEIVCWTPSYFGRQIERVTSRCTFNKLKVIEILGFVGRTIDVELTTYLIENSGKLEKVIFDTRNPLFIGSASAFVTAKETRTAKRRAKQFGKSLPRELDLVII